MSQMDVNQQIENSLNGDKVALEQLLLDVQDLIFNLSLRMLGSISDAENATQDILIKVMTSLSSFRKECAFSTWVYRVATNYLINYKKSMFAKHPLSFDFYGNDIQKGYIDNYSVDLKAVDEDLLAEELKLSCTNVMLQCLDPESRCIFILGTMFKLDSRIAGDILGIRADHYRQKLSRTRKKMAEFLSCYCGLSKTGACNCKKRIGYAIKSHRLNPLKLEYSGLEQLEENLLVTYTEKMETIDDLSTIFDNTIKYKSPSAAKAFIKAFLKSEEMKFIQNIIV